MIKFNEPMGSVLSDQQAQCRNVDNMAAYENRRQAQVTALNAPDCYAYDGGVMTVSGGAAERAPPSNLIDVETQLCRGANSLTSCRLYRPKAAETADKAIHSAMFSPVAGPPSCAGSVRSIPTNKLRSEFPEYTYFQPFTDGLPPLPSGTILPGIDTRRELKDAWKQRNPATPDPAKVAFVPGMWTGPYGDSLQQGAASKIAPAKINPGPLYTNNYRGTDSWPLGSL